MKPVRFKVKWQNRTRLITLHPNSQVDLVDNYFNGEGYSSIAECYYLEDSNIIRECYTTGSDCDGRLTTYTGYSIPIKETKAPNNRNQAIIPQGWKRLSESQRDYLAEAMGY